MSARFVCPFILCVALVTNGFAVRLPKDETDEGEYRLESSQIPQQFKRGIMKMRIGKRQYNPYFLDLVDEDYEPEVLSREMLPNEYVEAVAKRRGIRGMRMG